MNCVPLPLRTCPFVACSVYSRKAPLPHLFFSVKRKREDRSNERKRWGLGLPDALSHPMHIGTFFPVCPEPLKTRVCHSTGLSVSTWDMDLSSPPSTYTVRLLPAGCLLCPSFPPSWAHFSTLYKTDS